MLPLLWVALAFTAGILLSCYATSSLWIWAVFSALFLSNLIVSRIYFKNALWLQRIRRQLNVGLPVLLLFAALGGLRYALSQPTWTMQDLP